MPSASSGGWTDFPPQRDAGGSYSGRGGGDRSSRGSEHSDNEGSAGGSALAEALALRDRERKRTMEERAAFERSEKQRAATYEPVRADVSAVYDPPSPAAPAPAAQAPPQDSSRSQYGSGRKAETPAAHAAAPFGHAAAAAALHGHAGASASSIPPASPAGGGRPAPSDAVSARSMSESTAAASSQQHGSLSSFVPQKLEADPDTDPTGPPPHRSTGPHGGAGGGEADDDGPLMPVAPLMLSPSAAAATASKLSPAGLAPLDLSDIRRFLTTPTPRAAGIVQVRQRAQKGDARCARPRLPAHRSATSCATGLASPTGYTPYIRRSSRTATGFSWHRRRGHRCV